MLFQPKYLTRTVRFHPAEADRLADTIANAIRKLENENSIIDSRVSELNFNWEGQRKELFMDHAAPHQRNNNSQISQLREQENAIRQIMVTRQESYPNPAYEE